MEEKEGPPPEYGFIDPAGPQQLLQTEHHHPHPRHSAGFELQANGPDRQIKPIKAESSSSFLRAARAGNLDKLLEFLKGSMDINTSNANGLNALHLASKEGHVHVVRELLSRGAAVDSATKKGNTALHIASLAGQAEIVEILVETSAKVNVQSQNGFTPLYMAAQENHSEVVKFLLANGANQTLSTEDGFTPLAVALQQGHDRVVAVLLENDSRGKVHLPALHIAAKKDDVKATTLLLQNEHNADTNKNGGLVNDTTKSGFTPLHIACHYGNINVGRLLIDKGADVNFKARNSITPLHVAGKWGRGNMVELLLDAQANIDARTRDGLTPLHCAARSGHDQVVDLLLERGASVTCKTKNGLTPLHMSSQGDHVDCARLLLYHKAPIDEVTVDYLTPLHVVAHCGNVKTAKLLLDRKCEVNARALNGFTPLHIACKKNRIKIVELLLKYGASLEATTESGLTPLHVASFMGHMNIVVFLIQHGSNPNNTTMRGETALHLAARANQTDIIRILLRNGAQVDHAKAREQQTALHISSRLGNVDNVLLLLQHGASSDAVTKDFYTPLHIAAKEGHDEVVQVLLEHGAKQTLATKRGFTPLHVAAKYGNLKVVQMLIRRGTNPNLEGKNGLTPLHVATHYNRVNVALYLLEKNASSHCATKNGYTPLHIAAKKNQMDIATTLLEHGSNSDAESRNGFTPLHLAAQEGHSDMVALLAEHGADVNCSAKNGLTPLHLTAQEDHVPVAGVLVSHKANIDPQTKAGYTPLHTACHFGQIGMIRFLLDHGAAVNSTTKLGYTPLHQAAQQGHVLVINLLLKHQASPNAITSTGQTPLSIAQRLGYISVVEILKHLTMVTVDPAAMEEKYKVMFPETMQEAPMSDSEEEGGEESILVDQSFQYLASAEKPLEDNNIGKGDKEDYLFDQLSEKGSRSSSLGKGAFIDDTKYSKESSILPSDFKGIKDDNMIMSFSECSQTSIKLEMIQSDLVPYEYASQEIMSCRTNQYDEADCYQYASSFSGVSNAQSYETSADFSSDQSATYSGMIKWKSFLVSFMVDARGGAMRGCRHSGVRIIIPPGKACMPTRITCRLVKKEKVMHPPALMEGEALASRILEMGPVGARFSGPVIIEVPHFASLRGKEREITVLRSENGQTWREHTVPATEEAVHDALQGASFTDLESAEDLLEKRITRILTTDIPQYFAVVARVRQETSTIGPDGGMISSTVVPRVQAIFPEGSLTKNIKVGLQVQPVSSELVSKMLGNRVAVSPIVTVEPRRRKFHKPITLTIPLPMAAQKGMLNQYGGESPTLRLLCSIMGGTSPAQWEDITGTTPLTFINDCVSFTTTVSARFWLMDCQNVNESAKMASDLYHEIILIPYMARFVVFAKRHDAMEARLRIFCMTDDKMDKLLENREHFKHAARSVDVEVLEGKPQYIEMGGNLVPVTKSGEKLCVGFRAFRENRLPIVVRIRDFNHEASGLMAFMREPKGARSGVSQVPICSLTIALPDYEPSEPPAELEELQMNYESIKKRPGEEQISTDEPWLTDVAELLGPDWVKLAHQMKIEESDIAKAEEQYEDDSKRAIVILRLWIKKSGKRATGNALEKVLKSIGHEEIVRKCLYDMGQTTDAVEKARVYLDSSTAGFDALREELGFSQGSSVPRGDVSLDVSYEEQDILKESESIADESSTTLDGNNMELASLDDGETIPGVESSGKIHPVEESIDKVEGSRVKAVDNQFSDVNYKESSRQGTIEKQVDESMNAKWDSNQKTSVPTEDVIVETKVEPWHIAFSEPWYSNLSEGPDERSTEAMTTVVRSNIPAHRVQQGQVAPSITVTEDNSIPVDEDDFVQYYGLEAYRDKDYSDSDTTNSKTKDSGTEKEEEVDRNDGWDKSVNDGQKKSEEIAEQKMLDDDVVAIASDKLLTDICDFRQEAEKNVDISLEVEEERQEDDLVRAGFRVESSVPSFLMMAPQINIQGASPVVLSPTDDSSTTFIGHHGETVDMEKVCEQVAMELVFEAQAASNASSDMADTVVSEGHDKEVDDRQEGDDEECVVFEGARSIVEPLQLSALQAEDQDDDGMGISFEEDVGNVPLSPTDYSLMDESEVYSVDLAKDGFCDGSAMEEEKDMFSGHAASSSALVGRPPSPSDYTLLTESTEGSDLIGMTEQGMTEDVFAIPEPVEPLMEGYCAFLESSGNKLVDVSGEAVSAAAAAAAGRDVMLPPDEDELCVKSSGDIVSQALDDDEASSCSSNSEVARLEEIGTHYQEPAKQLKIDEKSEETDVDDAFSPNTRDMSNPFDFVHPVSLSPTVQSPLEKISPTAEWALKDEVSPVTVLPERLQIYVGMSPSEFISEESGTVGEFYLLGQRSEQSVAPGGCFRPIVESGGSDELEIVFQSSAASAAAASKPEGEIEEWVDEGFGRDASDEDSSNEEKQDNECSIKETEKPRRDFSDEGLEESLQTELLSLGASGAIEQAKEQHRTDDHAEEVVEADFSLSGQSEAWNVQMEDYEVISRQELDLINSARKKDDQSDIGSETSSELLAIALVVPDVNEMDFGMDSQRSYQTVQGFNNERVKVNDADICEPHINIREVYEAEVLQSVLEKHTLQQFDGESSRSYLLAYAGSKSERRETELSELFLKQHMMSVLDEYEASASISDTSVNFLANFEPYYEAQFPDKTVASVGDGVKQGGEGFHRSSVDPAVMENFFSNQESVDRTESPSFDSEEMDRSYGDDQRTEMAEELRTEMAEELRSEVEEESAVETGEESVQFENQLQMEIVATGVFEAETELAQNFKTEQWKHKVQEDLLIDEIRTKEMEEMMTMEMVRDSKMSMASRLSLETEEESKAVVEYAEELVAAAKAQIVDDLRTKLMEELYAEAEEDSTKLLAELKPEFSEELRSETEDVSVDLTGEIMRDIMESSTKLQQHLTAEELETDHAEALKTTTDQESWTELLEKLETEVKKESVELVEGLRMEISEELQEVAAESLLLSSSSTGDGGMLVEKYENVCQSEAEQLYAQPEDQLKVKITEELVAEESDSSRPLLPADQQSSEHKSGCILSRDEPSISSEDVPKTSTSSDTSAEPTILAATYDLELGAVSRVVATYDISPDSVEKTMTMEMATKAILSSPDDEVFETELANGRRASPADERGEVRASQNGSTEKVFDVGVGWAMGGGGVDQQSGSFEIVGLEDVAGYDEYLERLQQSQGLVDDAPCAGTVPADCNRKLDYFEVVHSVSKDGGKDAEEEEESDDDEEDTFNEVRYSKDYYVAEGVPPSDRSMELDCSHLPNISHQYASVSGDGQHQSERSDQRETRRSCEDGVWSSPAEMGNQEFPSKSWEENQDMSSMVSDTVLKNGSALVGDSVKQTGEDPDVGQSDSDQILYDVNGLSYISSDIREQPGDVMPVLGYSGKRALYSEATYQMFSTTEDTPEDDEDEEDFPNYDVEKTLADELEDSMPQSEDLITEKKTDSEESLCDEPRLVGARLVSEDAEPELLALNDEEDEEDAELESTYLHSVRVIECRDPVDDPDELPSFTNFRLSPRRPDLERPLSPVPDDLRRIPDDDEALRSSSGSENSDEDFVSDQVLQESRSFEHIENSRSACISGSENLDDYGNEEPDGTRYEESFVKDDFLTKEDSDLTSEILNSQVTDFVNLVLREATLVVQNNQFDMEDCELGDFGKTYERTSEEDDETEDIRFGGAGFFTQTHSALQTVLNEQRTETVQTASSSWSFHEMSGGEGEKAFVRTISEHHQTGSQLESSKSKEDTQLQTSVHSEVYSVDENDQIIVKMTDVEEIDSESRENEAYREDTVQEDGAEMSRSFFDENEALITETLTNQLVQHAMGEGHCERYEQTNDYLQEDLITLDSHRLSDPSIEKTTEKKVSHVEMCVAEKIFEVLQEAKEIFTRLDEQRTDLGEYHHDGDEFLHRGRTVLSTKFDSVGFHDECSLLDFGSSEPMSPENEGDSSSVDSFATVVPCHPETDDRLAELSSVSSSFHSDVHTSVQEEPYISIDVRDADDNQEGSTEQEDSSSSSDRFELLDRAELDSSIIEVLPSLDSPDETEVEKDDFDTASMMTLATIREEEEKASLSGKSEKTSESSDKVEVTSDCSDRMTSSPEPMADSPGLTVGGRFFSARYLEKDNISVSSSLLEFERLEKELQDKTSFDSLTVTSSGESHGKSSDKDDVSISSSLAEFERLEGEFTQSDSMDRISLDRFIGSTSSLNAFPMIDVGKPKSPLEQNLFVEQFEAEAEKMVSLLEIGSLALRQGPPDVDVGAKDRSVVAEETAARTLPGSGITDEAGAAYPQYQDIVQILRDASEGVENFEFGGRGVDLVEEDSAEGKVIHSEGEMQDDESDSEAVVTVRTAIHGKESIDLDVEGDDDSLQESESQSRSGTLDSELHADQLSIMQASMDSFEFDSCPVSMLMEPGPTTPSEAAQLGRLLRSEVDVFSEIGNPASTSHDDIRCFSDFEESGHEFCLIQSCPRPESDSIMNQLQPSSDREFVDVFGGDVDEGDVASSLSKQPIQDVHSMEHSIESGAWSQSDSLISMENVKSSDSSTRDIMLMSLDSPEGRSDCGAHESALRQEQMRDGMSGLNIGQQKDTRREESEEMVDHRSEAAAQSTPDKDLLFGDGDLLLEKFRVEEHDSSEVLISSGMISHSQFSPIFPMEDLLQTDLSDCATFPAEPDCHDLLMFDTNKQTITGVQEAAVIPSTCEVSVIPSTREVSLPGADEQVSRVILRKQIHKKTIVHDGKEETIVTEDTRIEQDPNAPVELSDSVQELIHQFLDSNGDPGPGDDGSAAPE